MAIMAISADQCQNLVNYATADLIKKANICTERFEIEQLKVLAESMGISINFDEIWAETKKQTIEQLHNQNINKFFGI